MINDNAQLDHSARLNLARKVDRATLQQQLFGQRGFTSIGMRDNREGSAGVD